MPAGLSPRGERFYRRWLAEMDLDGPHEGLLLAEAAQTITLLDDLRAQIERDGYMIEGSAGQLRLHPAVTETTKADALLARLVAQLAPRDPVDPVESRRARHAANVRWGRAGGAV